MVRNANLGKEKLLGPVPAFLQDLSQNGRSELRHVMETLQ
jgi:hypothetical protein